MRRGAHVATVFLVVSTLGWLGLAPLASATDENPESFIATLADTAIRDLTDGPVPRDIRIERLERIIAEKFAAKSIATWILGRYWKPATDAQRDRYHSIYARLMTESYVDRFTRYNGENLEVLRASEQGSNESMVKTVMQRPGGYDPIKIDWRLRIIDGKWKVLDILVEGVSMAQAQRSEFASSLRRLGGDMDAFLDELEQRANEVASR